MPVAPNSLLFDIAGDKAYMGSDFGAQLINPSSFGTSNNPFTGLGTVTGKVLATSNNGTIAVFSDTIHTPNQVYVVNTATATNLSANALNITGAATAAFSPDGLKTFITGGTVGSSLYIYSSLQSLQGPIALSGPANAIAFSPNPAIADSVDARGFQLRGDGPPRAVPGAGRVARELPAGPFDVVVRRHQQPADLRADAGNGKRSLNGKEH